MICAYCADDNYANCTCNNQQTKTTKETKPPMPIIAKESAGGAHVAAGTYYARCFLIVDAGSEHDEKYKRDRRVLIVSWEIPSERIEVNGVDMPMSCSKFFNLSLSKKANLRRDLENWRGRAFTPEELKGFELRKLLGQPCQLQIIETAAGKSKVNAILGMPKGVNIDPPFNPLVEYSIDEGRSEVYEALPEWIRKRCEASLEWSNPKALAPVPTTEVIPDPEDLSVPF